MADWLALVIGNTRWHWAWFNQSELQQVWHTPHLARPPVSLRSTLVNQAPPHLLQLPVDVMEVWAVSVVPEQTKCLAHLASVNWIQQFPLIGGYPTMGLDRSVTLWGAGQRYGWPALVIDCGTALTFTGGVKGQFIGGAILLGLRSHFRALHEYTAALPEVMPPSDRPPCWATDTPSALQSGVIYTVLAGIQHFIYTWQRRYPATSILFTGGDGEYLHRLYRQHAPKPNQVLKDRTWFDPNLMFWGISAYRSEATRAL